MKNIVITPTAMPAPSQEPAKAEPKKTIVKTRSTSQAAAKRKVSFTGTKDPSIAELENNGYTVISVEKYGVVAQREKGNKVFLTRTEKGYMDARVRVAMTLPESVQKRVKIKCTEEGKTVLQYISDLIMADLESSTK